MPSENHIHSYVRVDGKDKNRFMCYAPTCSHWTFKKFLINKLSACPQCGTHFVLTRDDLRRQTPKCLNCRDTKEGREFREKAALVPKVIESIFVEDPVDEHGQKDPKEEYTPSTIFGFDDTKTEESERQSIFDSGDDEIDNGSETREGSSSHW